MLNPFMERAIQLSLENVRSGHGGPFGAVIVRQAKIIAEGVNRVTQTNDPTAHAEVVAIREACRKLHLFELKGCEVYTSCEPCPMCLGAIYWARPDRVYFGNTAADAARVRIRRFAYLPRNFGAAFAAQDSHDSDDARRSARSVSCLERNARQNTVLTGERLQSRREAIEFTDNESHQLRILQNILVIVDLRDMFDGPIIHRDSISAVAQATDPCEGGYQRCRKRAADCTTFRGRA